MIQEREWESIYAAIESANKRSEMAEGIVIDHDADGEHIYVQGFGSEPVAIAALEYNHTIYKGTVKNTIRSEPVIPPIGSRVLVARPGGSLHRPRVVGIVRENLDWKQPQDIQVVDLSPGDDFTFDDLTVDSITFLPDVILYRGGTDLLKTDDAFEIKRGASSDTALQTRVGSDANPMFVVDTDGRLRWGPGGGTAPDTNLYRPSIGILKTDDTFVTAGPLEAQGGFVLSGGEIQIGAGTGAVAFTDIKYVTGGFNPAALGAHSGNVTTITLPSGSCDTNDLVINLGINDPGNRGVHFFSEPLASGTDQVRVWFFNTDTITLDHGSLTFHFLILRRA